jgi:hypothetical protein
MVDGTRDKRSLSIHNRQRQTPLRLTKQRKGYLPSFRQRHGPYVQTPIIYPPRRVVVDNVVIVPEL